ncbi:MAG TPA: hypothetical protein VFZ61_10775, partial [Polyangiales bacterium]
RLLLPLLLLGAAPLWSWLPSPGAAEDVAFAGHGPALSAITQALRAEKPVTAKPVGTSSVVFRLDLEGPIDAAFRPENRLNPRGHLAEIAAFRVGRALGLDHVAPAVPRSVPYADLQRMVQTSKPEAWSALSRELNQRSGLVHGVAIYWIPELRELGFDTQDGIVRLTRWLSQEGIPASREKSKLMAAQLSTMLGFDYLIANFDRFSGANIQGDPAGQRLYLRDHNMAFFEPLRVAHHERVLAHLKRTQRFSRGFVNALKELDAQRLSGALADRTDPSGFQVLSAGQIRSLLDRRAGLLSYIAALIDTYGERNVLTFP